ncbi:MAG: histidine kinase dimerization/phospho-acceptor domain-containing protein [Kineosporiaceae bacterium]
MPTPVQVWLLALGWSGGVGVAALVLLRLRPARSVQARLIAAATVSAVSVLAGVVGAARAMFLSAHDLDVVMQVAVVASAVALASALLAGREVVRDARRLRAQARRLADAPESGPVSGTASGPESGPVRGGRATVGLRELADVERELLDAGRRLAQARRREQSLEASRRELVAWVSHDLRTPLAGIRAMAEALDDGVAPDPARYHAQIVREVDRLAHLVDDLFELSRLQAGTLRLARQRLDLRVVVHDAVESGSALGTPLPPPQVPATPVWVSGDVGALTRAVSNLVVNALRYSPAGSPVAVALEVDGDGAACVSVADACGGIPEADLPRLFEPGWRGDAARTPGTSGPSGRPGAPGPSGGGLGLAVARGLVRGHGGDITVANTAVGCRAVVALPLE